MSGKVRTRHKSSSKIEEYLGKSKELLPTEVPTLRDCLRLALHVQKKHLIELGKGKTKPMSEVLVEVVEKVFGQWQLSNLMFKPPVTITPQGLKQKLNNCWEKIRILVWNKKKISERERETFENKLDKLVDIVICKCPITLCPIPCNKTCPGAHITCTCLKHMKVPISDLAWLHAQRQKEQERSSLAISGAVDKVEGEKRMKTDDRKQAEEERLDRKRKHVPYQDHVKMEDLLESEDEETVKKKSRARSSNITARLKLARATLAAGSEETITLDQEVETILAPKEAGELLVEEEADDNEKEDSNLEKEIVDEEVKKEKSQRNDMPIPNTAAASVRFGTSQSETAAITSGFLLDLIEAGHLPPEKAFLAVTRNKVARGKTAVLKSAGERGEEAANQDIITAIYFDGRKDKTQVKQF